ncbi:hypothetical protein WK55_09790 [Burkholderia ubonensis]|uniref:hypothetical protein n=1 Tax=Burkholderia ubonensis TaxID=101571 RepID=UPI00075F210D|nr:hypothetical protein [Burkholderia ubonensis]KVT60627.1 hypothetical protein WK55_09790 [Burkholderia ubonensis]
MIKNVGRYRKVYTCLWADEKFSELVPLAPGGQALWLYLLTGPHTLPIPGVYAVSEATIADRLHWRVEAVRKSLDEIIALGMVMFDRRHGLLFIPNAMHYDPPANPNVVRSWGKLWGELPECDLKRIAYDALRTLVVQRGENFTYAFDAVIVRPEPVPPNRSRNSSDDGSANGSENGMANQNFKSSKKEHKTLKPKVKDKDMSISETVSGTVSTSASIAEVREVFAYWQQVMSSPRSKLDDKRTALIRRAFSDGYTLDELRDAIRGCSRSPWHMGQNDRGQTYNGLDLILRSAEKIDMFRQIDAHPPLAVANGNGHRMTAEERREAISERNMREFLGQGREPPDDPMTIDEEA